MNHILLAINDFTYICIEHNILYTNRMNTASDISNSFPKHLFWDINMDNLSIERDKDMIIPRALFQSNELNFDHEITNLERFYSPDEIVECLKITKERISNNLCLLVASRYNVEPFYRYVK